MSEIVEISTPEELDAIRYDLNAHYKLINDIDLDVAPYNEGEGWKPIGSSDNRFQGVLDGNAFIINNLYINRDSPSQSLFGDGRNCEVRNLGIDNAFIKGSDSTSTTYPDHSAAGILFSHLNRNGGLSKINNVAIKGVVEGGSSVSGIVGVIHDTVEIKNTYSICDITTSDDNFSGIFYGYSNGDGLIENCYAVGITNGGNAFGGRETDVNISNSFYDKDVNGTINGDNGATGLTSSEMQNPQTFIDAGWDTELNDDGEQVWWLENGEYPELLFNILVGMIINPPLEIYYNRTLIEGEIASLDSEINSIDIYFDYKTLPFEENDSVDIDFERVFIGNFNSIGLFNKMIEGLNMQTKYYVRATAVTQ